MGILLKLRSILLEYSGNRNIILKQKDEIQELNKEIIKQDRIIFKLKSKINKLNEENIILKTKNKEINFNFFDREIEKEILNKLSLAKKEVNIAVAWITSKDLIAKLEELSNNKIIVNIIVTKDKKKEEKNYYIESLRRLKGLANKFNVLEIKSLNSRYTNYMHNKYCIIDNNIVIDGSYNWSKSAKYNEEHIIVVESEIVAKMYKENFGELMNYYSNNRKTLIS